MIINPATIGLVLGAISTIISAAPKVVEIYQKAKDMVSVLFSAKLISKEQQDAIHAHIDSIKALVDADIVPPSWQVDPDPE